jgi:hypothetical protein
VESRLWDSDKCLVLMTVFTMAPLHHSSVLHSSRYSDWATGWTIRGSNLGRSKRFLPSPNRPDWLWDLPSFLSNGYWGFFPGSKAAGAWSWPSPRSNAEVKNEWSYTSTPPICLYDIYRDNFTFFLPMPCFSQSLHKEFVIYELLPVLTYQHGLHYLDQLYSKESFRLIITGLQTYNYVPKTFCFVVGLA